MRLLLLLPLILISIGCASKQPKNKEHSLIIKEATTLSKTIEQTSLTEKSIKIKTNGSTIVENSAKADSTIELLSELFLAPIGLRSIGTACKDTSKAVRKEIIEPIDNLRRFEIGDYKFTLEADINEKLDTFYFQLTIRF